MDKNMETELNAQKVAITASILLKLKEENKLSQESVEDETWKVGYQDACKMVEDYIKELIK